MDHPSADNVATLTKKVSAYGSQLAAVFHSYGLSAERVPRGFEGAINVLDATVVALNQALGLLESEAEYVRDGIGRRAFSEEALEYVKLLATECATTLAKVEPIVADACLSTKERKAKRKQKKKESRKKKSPNPLNIDALKLDQDSFLAVVESAKWSLATEEIGECMERLYDIQLHLLLVFQVVSVGVMSKDLSSGKVDLKSVVAFHDRINRTAELLGIKTIPKGRSRNKRARYEVSSESEDFFSHSSDSDSSSTKSFKRAGARKSRSGRASPLPSWMREPPPPPPPAMEPSPLPLRNASSSSLPPPPPSPPPETLAGTTAEPVNPPSYSESKPAGPASSPTTSTLLGTVSEPSSDATANSSEKANASQASEFPADKKESKEVPPKKEETKPAALEPRLFKSNTQGFRFKVKSLFSSNKSLAEEMKKVLSDADSALLAVVIHAGSMRQVPHSAFHSLEATHMRTILSQINGQEWYDTFTKMDSQEHMVLGNILRPYWIKGVKYERELVVLKVVHERKHAWAVVLRDILSKFPSLHVNNSRVLLAIVREKLFDGKPMPLYSMHLPPPPPPPPPPPAGLAPLPARMTFDIVPKVRPPPGLPAPPSRSTKVSDLNQSPSFFPPTLVGATAPVYGCAAPTQTFIRPEPLIGTSVESTRISDTTPLTEYDATIALSTYVEYTLRLTEALNPGMPRSWARVSVTQESAERNLIVQRVMEFQRAGGNALEVTLRLTEQQSSQVTRLMDELRANERDVRFEWCWVEVSLYNSFGEITDFTPHGGFPKVAAATMMHLVARRMPKAHCKPLELYNSLMRPAPAPMGYPIIVNERHYRERSRSRSRSRSRNFRRRDYDSDTSYFNSDSSDDSSVGYVRRKLRKDRVRRSRWSANPDYSDSDAETVDEDVITVKLELKRGDDVVQSLLNLWTPQADVKGKGKET